MIFLGLLECFFGGWIFAPVIALELFRKPPRFYTFAWGSIFTEVILIYCHTVLAFLLKPFPFSCYFYLEVYFFLRI